MPVAGSVPSTGTPSPCATPFFSGKVKIRFGVPGVAQRTGATIYYVEIIDSPNAVLALMPVPGDVDIVIVPPPFMADALAAGRIDGYCVGEPWNSVGVETAGGHCATVKALIWQHSPDKVIGMRADWAERHPDTVAAIIRAVPASHGLGMTKQPEACRSAKA